MASAIRKTLRPACGPPRLRRHPAHLLAGIALVLAVATAGAAQPVGQEGRVADASPETIASRMLSPLVHRGVEAAVARKGAGFPPVPLPDPARHEIRVPRSVGDRPLGLLVFVPPTDQFRIPAAWHAPLDEAALVVVVARDSGNGRDVLTRRVPLALQGAAFATAGHAIDPSRVYVAGFSGGSRVAQMLAVGYPDIFRGALLMAGSDPLGSPQLAVPPRGLMSLLQARSRIVLATGRRDVVPVQRDRDAAASLRRLCVRGLVVDHAGPRGHRLPAAAEFRRALRLLERPVAGGPPAGCLARLQSRIDEGLQRVTSDLDRGRLHDAGRALRALDIAYGGLAAPGILALSARLEAADGQAGGS